MLFTMVVDNIQHLQNNLGDTVFLYPIPQDDRLHRSCPIIGFVLIDIATKQVYTVANGHPEGVYNNSSLDYLTNKKVYCYNAMLLKYAGYDTSEYLDVRMQYYLYTNQGYTQETSGIISHYTRQFQNCFMINHLIPLYKHEEIAKQVCEDIFIKDPQQGLSFYQNDLMDVFYNIEKNGLSIHQEVFVERFGTTISRQREFCYTEYNFYTTTGRPSNRFGGINFAALNKEDNTRDAFNSRYLDGNLVELDFNSYHPRLIAQLIDYDFGSDNVYEHLATYYANTPTPTQEQIESAKEDTFRQLYGGIQQQYLHIPFFAKTNDLAKYLWKTINDKGYIESPISGRRIYLHNHSDLNAGVLFNYFVQMYETETNVILLKNIHKHLEGKLTKPILYTYDSVLFDVPPEEHDYLLNIVIPKSIDLTKFPIKIKQGKTYRNMQV